VSALSQIVSLGVCLWIVLRRPAGTTSQAGGDTGSQRSASPLAASA
jgi:hypothetical protein